MNNANVKTDAEDTYTVEPTTTEIHKFVNVCLQTDACTARHQDTITELARDLDDLPVQCQFTIQPYTKEHAMRNALIFGTSDDRFHQGALAKDFDYLNLTRAALGCEQSWRASGTIKSTSEEVRQSHILKLKSTTSSPEF